MTLTDISLDESTQVIHFRLNGKAAQSLADERGREVITVEGRRMPQPLARIVIEELRARMRWQMIESEAVLFEAGDRLPRYGLMSRLTPGGVI